MKDRVRLEAEYTPMSNSINIYGSTYSDGGIISDVVDLTMQERDIDNPYDGKPPFMSITKDEATLLMDSLWTAGIRPNESIRASRNDGALERMEDHLEDMRKIVFAKLKIVKP